MRKILLLLLAVILVLAAVTVTRALGLDSRQLQVAPLPPRPVPLAALADTLSQAIALRTVSYQEESQLDTAAFAALHQLLADRFPRVQQALEREVVSGWSLFYRWPGSDPSLAPVLLTGHLDVVPVDPDTTGAWLHPPFAGEQAEGYVWGRGAIDDKGGVITVLG
ncbi:MAG TPA: M20/M25/M40 family metallo-hydrolase, partial [Thermoanaerobaculia bacterium]|nr:M20/M25/M40 family metallo-hydrolase [Thermoanaerobaculia bacterium]